MTKNYEMLINSGLAVEASDISLRTRDFLPVCYQYDPEIFSQIRPELFLRLTGSGRIDASGNFTLSVRPADVMLLLYSMRGSGMFLPGISGKSGSLLQEGSLLLYHCCRPCRLQPSLLPWSFRMFFLEGAAFRQFLPVLNHLFITGPSSPSMAFAVEELASFPEEIDLPALFSMHRILTDLLSEACANALARGRTTLSKTYAVPMTREQETLSKIGDDPMAREQETLSKIGADHMARGQETLSKIGADSLAHGQEILSKIGADSLAHGQGTLSEIGADHMACGQTALKLQRLPAYLRDLNRYIHDCTNLHFSLENLENLYGISRYRLCRE